MSKDKSLTSSQATDLARYFLGRNWCAGSDGPGAFGAFRTFWLYDSSVDFTQSYRGTSWREVFRRAGVKLPYRPRYVSHGCTVLLANRVIATCPSGSLADRVCSALNAQEPAA